MGGRFRLGAACLVFVAAGMLTGGVWAQEAAPAGAGSPAAPAVRTVDDVLESIRAKHGLPALAAVVLKGGEVVGEGVVGVRKVGSEERVTAEDRWHLGSCTKAMTATLCAMLVEEGKLSWESTVGEVLPDLAAEGREAYRGVTLRQLLTHRAGVVANLPMQGLFRTNKAALPEQRRQYVRALLQLEPVHEPGTAFLYSNAGYTVAGAMAEAVTGKPWEDLMRERLFAPLGMDSAGFGPPSENGSLDQPWGHGARDGERTPSQSDNPAVIGPAGTVHCTLSDWARFVSLHVRGARGETGLLLKPETFVALHAPSEDGTYAMGWGVAPRPWAGGTALTHAGSNTIWFAVVWAAPERDFAVLVASNAGDGAKACDEVVGAMIGAFLGP